MTTTEVGMFLGGIVSLAIQSLASNAKQKRDTATKIAGIKAASEQWVRDHFAKLSADLMRRLDNAEAAHRECEKRLNRLSETLTEIIPDPAE